MQNINKQQSEIIKEKIDEVLKHIKGRKAAGEEKKGPKMIELLGDRGKEWLWRLSKEAWKTEKISKDWKHNFMHVQKS